MDNDDKRRIWVKITDRISRSTDHMGCRTWSGGRSGGVPGNRYPTVYIDGDMHYVARLLFELTVGDIPEGYVIKPWCNNRQCVEATHMRAITPSDRATISPGGVGRANRYKTHCPQGHAYDTTDSRGSRRCTICRRETVRRFKNK